MSEPIISNAQDGADETPPVPTNAEDRKTAAAMSNLEGRGDEDEGGKEVDADALGKAMKNLNVKDEGAKKTEGKKIKVEAADVSLLVSWKVWGFCDVC